MPCSRLFGEEFQRRLIPPQAVAHDRHFDVPIAAILSNRVQCGGVLVERFPDWLELGVSFRLA